MVSETIIFAGGGTGGHIYPAIAIAQAMREIDPKLEIHFVGTPSGLETKIIPREGYPLHLIKVGKLNQTGGIFGKINTLVRLPWAFIKSFVLLLKLRPKIVLGVGGYASGPVVLCAALMGIKTAIWEPNAYPGLTNRWLSKFVDKIYIVFRDAVKFFNQKKTRAVGLPIRKALDEFNFDQSNPDKKINTFNVLVFGGSQGARAINTVLSEAVTENTEWLNSIHLIHQTGSLDFNLVQQKYADKNIYNLKNAKVECKEYLHNMENYYAWADLIICRSGASTVAEVIASGRTCIFIPLPTAADNHQFKNAESLVKQNAAMLINQKDLTPKILIEKILELKNNPTILMRFRENLKKLHSPKAAQMLAKHLLAESDKA